MLCRLSLHYVSKTKTLDAANHLCFRSRSDSPYFPLVGKNSMRTVVGGGFSFLLQNVLEHTALTASAGELWMNLVR